MSPLQTGGQAAVGFIDALKNQPLLLALCVISFGLIGLLYFQSMQFTNQRRENVALFIGVQKEVQLLLSRCVIPPNQQRSDLQHLIQP